MKKTLRKLIENSSGSATITVIVSMMLVIALESALLFGAYTAYRIALTQRADAKTFYTAENAMDDIRAGVQNAVSAALAQAYTDTLTEYARNTGVDYDPQKEFASKFNLELLNADFYDSDKYITSALKTFAQLPEGVQCTVGAGGVYNAESGAAILSFEDNGALETITLSQVSLKWLQNGYESDIVSDIVINVPSFSGRLGEYAIVAGGGITQNAGAGSITGSVFCGADIAVGRAGEDTDASLALSGDIFVADDLLVSGANCSVSLSGEYYGVGNDFDNSNSSSAILVNGKNAHLNLAGLNTLSLAGYSFIDVAGITSVLPPVGDSDFNGKKEIAMGQSMAFKANQLAYLVPAEAITNYAANPCELREFTPDAAGADAQYVQVQVNKDYILWDDKTLEYYGTPITLYKNLGSGRVRIAYVFLEFKSKDLANEYFKKYFELYPERISQYMSFYMDLSSAATDSVMAAGNTFYTENGELKRLDARAPTVKEPRSFESFVNKSKLDELSDNTTLTFTFGGKTAVVTNISDYKATGSECLIICSGNVTVDNSVEGSVLAEGTVNMGIGRSVTAAALPAGMESMLSGGYKLSDFLKTSCDDNTGEGNAWAAEGLVIYANWSKN